MRRIGTPKRAVATLGLAMVLVIGAMAIPAHAVHWTLGYAFGNTDVLCYGCPKSNSNAAGFWEQALVSHWGLPGTGVDGVFGNSDDVSSISIGNFVFTLSLGTDGLPNTSDDLVTGYNSAGTIVSRSTVTVRRL